MIGLHLMAKDLALARADKAAFGNQWYIGKHRLVWRISTRKWGISMPEGPTGQYYRIIDNITAGVSP